MNKYYALFLSILLAGMAGCGEGSTINEGGNGSKTGENGDDDVIPVELCQESDEDGDTIADKDEGKEDNVDTDGDDEPDYLDKDSDNDTIPDSVEARNGGNPCQKPAATTMTPNFRSTDSDSNGIPDSQEAGPNPNDPVDTDNNGVPDYADEDNDGDNLSDIDEISGLTAGHGADLHTGRKCDEHCTCGDNGQWCKEGSASAPWDSDGDTTPDYMDTDSNNDGVPDLYKGAADSDDDGVMDVYSTDSDGDTIPDKDEFGNGDKPLDTDNDGVFDFQDADSDNDGLLDRDEIRCESLNKDSRLFADTDDDKQSDMAEYALAKQNGKDPVEYVCDSSKTVLDFVDFYFELSTTDTDEIKTMPLLFQPVITNADVMLNIDNTGSMGSTIEALQQNFSNVIVPSVRESVKESWFGVSIFRDFDIEPVWQLKKAMTDDEAAFNSALSKVRELNADSDAPEAGYESLYEIATGDVSQGSPSKAYSEVGGSKPTGENLVGGVGFRKGSMPIILHVSDASSHEIKGGRGHDAATTFNALNQIGARVVPINITSNEEKDKLLATGLRMATSTNAIVPVCAYHRPDGWVCGENKCCTDPYNDTSTPGTPNGVAPDSNNNCVLSLDMGAAPSKKNFKSKNLIAYKSMLAIEALIKYGTYNVSTHVIGQPFQENEIAGDKTDTSCFIDHIEAVSYTPPSNAIVSDCLASLDTRPKDFAGKGFNDGFEHFAVGAAAADQDTSKLEFKVFAKNNNCVQPSPEVRSYRATIQVWDPQTKLVFDEQDVVILVPAAPSHMN